MFNVKLKKAGGPKKYFKYKECEAGQVLVEGTYLGTSPNKFGKENFEFKSADGSGVVCLNHAGHLAHLIESNLVVGQYCRITFEGKDILEKGAFAGKEVNKFSLEIADEDSPEESQVALDFNAAEIKAVEEAVKKAAAPTATPAKKMAKASVATAPKIDLSDLD